ncbi:hypothetical protein SAY87_018938 [Trapa incisa]|uniref:Uncharacterized protein n=1 Tax=Trapa incisa TaxID=236973 RepID=A0AAN7Q0X4_9MYRT|nr:hypothetical protein SAY87_018938 [Trapa incisa]
MICRKKRLELGDKTESRTDPNCKKKQSTVQSHGSGRFDSLVQIPKVVFLISFWDGGIQKAEMESDSSEF